MPPQYFHSRCVQKHIKSNCPPPPVSHSIKKVNCKKGDRDYVCFICQTDLAEILNKYSLSDLHDFKYLHMITPNSKSFK